MIRKRKLCTSNDDTTNKSKKHKVLRLQQLNKHIRDDYVVFYENDHTYSIDWCHDGTYSSKDIISVSQLCSQFFPKFDEDSIIEKMMKSKTWSKSKYFGMSKNDIKSQWKKIREKAAESGTYHHRIYELYYNGIHPETPYTKTIDQFLKFASDHGKNLIPFRTEWVVYTDIVHKICGTPDILFYDCSRKSYDGNLHLTMYDWKHCKKISKFSVQRETGLKPLHNIKNTNFFKYSFQLNIYKYILETYYTNITVQNKIYPKIIIDKMYIVCIHDSFDHYAEILLPDYQDLVKEIFDIRKNELESTKNLT